MVDPPGRIDVEVDVLLGLFRFEEEQLRNHQRCHLVVDSGAEEDHIVLEKPRVNVIGAFTTARLLDYHRNQHHSTPPPARRIISSTVAATRAAWRTRSNFFSAARFALCSAGGTPWRAASVAT